MQIALNRYSAQPLYLQIVHEVQRQISSGALPPGARLPTVRELARQLDINYLTVHSAYSQLQSAGWLKSTVGRGTFVAPRDAPPDVAGLGRELSARGLLSDMLRLSRTSGIHSLAAAEPAPELVPSRELERAVAEALKRGAQGLVTVDPQGDPRLRAALAALLAERGVKVSAEELLVTSGATQGLALVARALTQPGDTVLVEEPTGLSALNTLGMLGLRLVGAPVDADGLALEALEVLILAHRPRFLYIAPTFHGPGAPLSQVRRAALLTLAARYRLPVVEDDVYGLLSYDGPALAPLKAEDADGLVVYLSSFSKVLLPGVRIGYVAARAELIEQLSLAKQADDLGSSPLLQRALAIIMRRGWFAAHLRRALPIYRERRDVLLAALAQHCPEGVGWSTPPGGFCVWVTLPGGVSVTELYRAALERGVAFVPGDVFFAGGTSQVAMRLSFSSQPPEVLADVGALLGGLLSERQSVRAPKLPALPERVAVQ